MPEGYTHVRTARRAAQRAGLDLSCPEAFAAGANGPDVFFAFEAWRSGAKRSINLPALGARMHQHSTGVFLLSLLQNAETVAQWEYALGFLSHYAADCTLHPYVEAVSRPGQPYQEKGGHAYFEIGLDSYLCEKDLGSARIPVDEVMPALAGNCLWEVCALLRPCLFAVYGVDAGMDQLMEAFEHTRLLRRLFAVRNPLQRLLLRLADGFAGGKGSVSGHVSPAKLRGTEPNAAHPLPAQWLNSATGQTVDADVFALLETAERESERLMGAACRWREGVLDLEGLQKEIGSNDYGTGTPTPKSQQGGSALRNRA